MKTPTRLLAAVTLALAAAGAVAQLASAKQAPEVPGAIAVPAGHKPFLTGHATGVQIYACSAAGGGYAWSLVAPRASLYTAGGKLLTTHFAGPTWQAKDGSFVVGAVVDRAPVEGAIPWLLLAATSTSDVGRLAATGYIQRMATTGGLAPSAGCSAETAGATAEVAYTADYVFWKKKGA